MHFGLVVYLPSIFFIIILCSYELGFFTIECILFICKIQVNFSTTAHVCCSSNQKIHQTILVQYWFFGCPGSQSQIKN